MFHKPKRTQQHGLQKGEKEGHGGLIPHQRLWLDKLVLQWPDEGPGGLPGRLRGGDRGSCSAPTHHRRRAPGFGAMVVDAFSVLAGPFTAPSLLLWAAFLLAFLPGRFNEAPNMPSNSSESTLGTCSPASSRSRMACFSRLTSLRLPRWMASPAKGARLEEALLSLGSEV